MSGRRRFGAPSMSEPYRYQVALLIIGVIQALVGDGGAGDGSVEEVGVAQHC